MKKCIIALSFLFFSTIGYSQRKQTSFSQCLLDAKAFIEFVDTLNTFNYNFSQLKKRNKKLFLIRESMPVIKKGMYKYYSFLYNPVGEKILPISNPPYQEHAAEIFGGFHIILKKGKPYLLYGKYTLSDILGPEGYDSGFYKKMNGNVICKKCFKSKKKFSFTYYYNTIDNVEKKFLTKLVSKNLADSLILDYCQNSIETVIFKSKNTVEDYQLFSDTSFIGLNNVIYKPHIKHIIRIFLEKKYDVILKLLKTNSPIFNWFIAEALNYYNSKENFLTDKEIKEVKKFNDKNGFVKFRSNKLLSNLYK
jgi:hypothetical protein